MLKTLWKFIILSATILQLLLASVLAMGEDCVDMWGDSVSHGEMYIPGPNVCSNCVCYHSQPLWCKAIYCDPRDYIFCSDFRVGERCCEITCYDSEEKIK